METLRKLEQEYRSHYEDSSNDIWEFSQMFGEEESDSDVSGSGSVDGNIYLILTLKNIIQLFFRI